MAVLAPSQAQPVSAPTPLPDDAPFTPFWSGDNPVSWPIVLFGVVLPAFTLGFELVTGLCADVFFDPVPTVGHLLLVAVVPAVFLLLRLADSMRLDRVGRLLPTLLCCAVAVCLIYSLPFVPLLWFWVFALIYYGGGLLPMAPVLACAACVVVAWRLSREPRWNLHFGRRLGGGVVVGMLLFVAIEAQMIVTLVGMEMASAAGAQERNLGIRLLRGWGSDEEMRRLSFPTRLPGQSERPSPRTMLLHTFLRVDAVEAQDVYYRATGRLWDAVPPSEHRTILGRKRWTWSDNPGGDVGRSEIEPSPAREPVAGGETREPGQ